MRSRLIVSALLSLALAGAARAEIFKCVGQNGEVRFTSDASQCPRAQAHAPTAAVQRVEKAPAPLVSARPGATPVRRTSPAAQSDPSAGSEALWRKKRADAKEQLATAQAQLGVVVRAAGWCNRGHEVWTEDDKTGLRQEVDCKEVHSKLRELTQEQSRLEHYLAEGLEDECRQAGCLAGWVRE